MLSTPESTQTLLLQRTAGGEIRQQVTQKVVWSSSDPGVATVGRRRGPAVADGEALDRRPSLGAASATTKVVVTGMNQPVGVELPQPRRAGAGKARLQLGACHGALAGKGGFRLSLQGYDPAADHFNIVKQDRGRRVELADPGRSLVLAKPSGAIAHKGGVRFTTSGPEYRILADWIAAGAPPTSDADPRVERLEVLPAGSIHAVGQTQQIIVRAQRSDGRAEDVTRWVKWSSSDETVCRVDEDGVASVVGPGEGAVVAWYASQIAIARITVPYSGGKTVSPAGRDRRSAQAPELHRRADRPPACTAEPARLAAGERRRVHPPRLGRYDRRPADDR